LNAAVSGVIDENHQPSNEVSNWINAPNAPNWVEFQIPATGVVDNEVNHEHWMTSWTRASLQAFDGAYTTDFGFNGASQTGGGETLHHGTHEAGMDLDIDISVAEQNDAQAQVGSMDPLTPLEQAVVDRMVAVHNSRTVPIGRILIGFQRIVDAFNTSTNTTIAQLDSGNVHDNHFHVDYQPPAISTESGAAQLERPTIAAHGDLILPEEGFGSDDRLYYRFELANGLELSGRSNGSGDFSDVLTPNVRYVLTVYQASTNSSAVYRGQSSASGRITDIGTIILDQFGGPDADGDGVPDVGEHAIGTNPNSTDSDGDGISDDSELTQGLNPLDNSGFPTGVISNLPLPGNAEAVAVANDLVYVATGSHGLAVVDGTAFDNPILLGQIDLPGTAVDVDVDAARQIAAVATGSSLELVDVSDPMLPTVRQSVALNATRVEVVNGLAYAAAENFIRAIDLSTGTVVQTLILNVAGQVTAMAREGSMLYAFVGGSDTLLAIDVGLEGQAAFRGQIGVAVSTSDVGIFAGNDLIWITGGGLRTVDFSNPDVPINISGPDAQFSSRRVALNGSGLALVTPNVGNTLELYSSADPQDSDNFLTRFNLTGPARDVAISRGIGYVAVGSRLEVVNYRPFDAMGMPPTVTITAEVADADAGTPGIQVVEGGQVFVNAAVIDDVQARDVQWLVNGQVVDTDVSFPFDFVVSVPAIDQGGGTITIQARVTDTGGNSVLSDAQTFEIVPDTFAPTIDSQDPADGSTRFEGQRFIRVRFSEPINPAGVTQTSFRLMTAGPNGTPGDDDDIQVPAEVQLRDNDRLVQLTVAAPGLAPGSYQLIIDQSAVADRAGNALGTGPRVSTFTVVEFDESADFLPFGTDVSIRQDDTSFSINPMPFEFEFFGQTVSGPMYVTTNGVIEFAQNTIGGDYTNSGLPIGNSLVAMPFWDDLDPRAGGTIGLYDADGVRVITYLDIPYFSDISKRVSFQIAFFSNGQIQVRYGRMDSIADGSATIGLSNGTRTAVPSLGSIANDPTLEVTSANGLLSQTGLAALTADDQNDLLIFTPDGAGGYTITRNPGRPPVTESTPNISQADTPAVLISPQRRPRFPLAKHPASPQLDPDAVDQVFASTSERDWMYNP
jgi:hypothetical protein